MSASECQVRLHRDALSTPWGFRLQGGKDFKVPLTVQRVFVGSPADGELHRGDIILAIDNYDATQMIHKQAMDIIKQAGGSMALRLKSLGGRASSSTVALSIPGPVYSTLPTGSQFRSRPLENIGSPTKAAPVMYGHDYSGAGAFNVKQVANPMLNKIQHSLSQAVWNPAYDEYDDEYQPHTVSELRGTFDHQVYNPRPQDECEENEPHVPVRERKRQYDYLAKTKGRPKAKTIQRPLSYNTKPPWVKPDPHQVPQGLAEPGWSPSIDHSDSRGWPQTNGPQQLKYHPLPTPQYHSSKPQPMSHAAMNVQPVPMQQPRYYEPDSPAWVGSLKSSGGSKPWEMREAGSIAGPGVAPPQQQHYQPQVPVHQPRVQNMHYGPGDTAPTYSQGNQAPQESDTAQIKHLQYNSPIGLYSKSNAEAALQGQTQGKPGQGTMQVTGGPNKPYNPHNSDVYKLLHEEEARKKVQGGPTSARYQEPPAGNQGEVNYQGYVDHSKQSPAMGRLEQRIADGTVGTDLGTSDF